MKLLFAIKKLSSATGGAERVLCEVSSELASRGHDVTIVTFDQQGGQPFYHLDGRVKRIDLGVGESGRSARVVESLRRIALLRGVVKNEQPQVVIGFMHSMFILLAFSLIGSGIPVIGSEHIVPEHYRKRPLQYMLLALSSYFLSNITVLSKQIRQKYSKSIRGKMVVMPNPVMPAKGSSVPGGEKLKYTILNIGRLDKQKDHETLIRAFNVIAEIYPDWDLKIIGEGALYSKLQNLINELGLEGRVHLQGFTTNIENEYCDADVFAMSSRYEAFGLVTAEAMSYGLPVVGFADCPGTNELIQDDVTGYLVAEKKDRVEAFASALKKLLSNPSLRVKFGGAGKLALGKKYSINYVVDLWENLLTRYDYEI